MLARLLSLGCLGLCVLAATGCFTRLVRDERIREHLGEVKGRVGVQGWRGSPIIVVAGRLPDQRGQTLRIVRKFTLPEPDTYAFQLEPGSYLIAAVEDANRNERLDDGERAVLSAATEIHTRETEIVHLTVRDVFDRKTFRAKYDVLDVTVLAEGDVLPLSDPKFGPKLAEKGLWEPTAYAREERPGVYMLQPYAANKVPVLFIHGMSGYPQEFSSLIAALDDTRFQAWVALYPSGYPLQTIATALDTIVAGLAAEHGFDRMCVVAHSMGGLVARQFLSEQAQRTSGPHTVRGFVTLASPLHGIASANMGLKIAPAAVPSWYDIDPGGRFLEQLYATPLRKDIEYHLLFAFDDSGNSDGVVQLLSALRVEAQAEAEVVRGYRATHTGILKSKAAAAQVMTALRRCAGDESAPRVAPRPKEPVVVEDRH